MATMPGRPPVVKFGVFEVDLVAGELRKAGMRQKLAGQPFQVLQALLERPQEIVTREELRQRLWPGNTFIDHELALKKAVNRLREVLGDSAESPRFIETVPRRGYRFVCTITSLPSVRSDSSEAGLLDSVEAMERPVATAPSRAQIPRMLIVGLALAGIAALVFAFKIRTGIFANPRSLEIRSIAVLPLENLSKDPGQDYFSDGITDALTTDLAQIGAIRVISRTSATHFKGSRQTLPEIGRLLNVDSIVEGSVARSEGRLRITAQLIDARSDRHLWAKTYERDLKDILTLQDEVARDIAEEIRVNLSPQEQKRLTADRRTNPRAYDAYLRGRYLWNQRNAEAIAKAVGYFEQAAREDPGFAAAYSGLADCYSVGWGAKRDLHLAEEYARKALSLQPDLAEGHISLGAVHTSRYKPVDAGEEVRRALELSPNYAMAHHWHAALLLSLGRLSEALSENDRARQLDPFSIPINTMRGIILIGLRQYDQAANQIEKTVELAPQSPFLHDILARIYWLEGKAPEAITEGTKAEGLAANLAHSPERLGDQEITAAYAKSGLRAARIKAAQRMEKSQKGNPDAISVALLYGTLEDKNKVLQWLERSWHLQEANLLLMSKSAPEFEFLGTDPRFQDLLRRIGLPQ